MPKHSTIELTPTQRRQLSSFQKKLLQSRTILVVVGAGLSASSGLATFRGAGGLWRNFSAIDLATPDAFQLDPGLVWQFYSTRRYHALKARPNKGHFALAELSRRMTENGKKFLMLTQNVDGLSPRAGHDPDTCMEIHGSLFTVKCTNFDCTYAEKNNRDHPLTKALEGCEDEFVKPMKRKTNDDDDSTRKNVKLDDTDTQETIKSDTQQDTKITASTSLPSSPEIKPVKKIPEEDLPHCPQCKTGLLRPGVVWFGESLPLATLDTADDFLTDNKVDLCLVIGTSGSVWPAMGYVERVQNQKGSIAVFNTDSKDIAKVNNSGGWGFEGDAAEWLPLALEPLIGSEYLPRNWKKM